jgi:hypothetical protein
MVEPQARSLFDQLQALEELVSPADLGRLSTRHAAA